MTCQSGRESTKNLRIAVSRSLPLRSTARALPRFANLFGPHQRSSLLKDIMGWDDEFARRAAVPQYPCLIDKKHIVSELYEFINVPMVVWIDEKGRVVRPAEPAGVSDSIRAMDPKTFQIPPEVIAEGKRLRRSYVDAIRDWVAKGDQSEFVLSPEEARRRATGPDDTDALATRKLSVG